MSLETIHKKLHKFEEEPFWKFVLYCGILPAVITLAITPYINPDAVQVIEQHPLVKIMFIMAFTAVYLVLGFFAIVVGIGVCWFLIRFNEKFYNKYGKIIGKSLSTNNEFLLDLAKGLDRQFKKIRTDDVDLKTDELDKKYQREINEIKKDFMRAYQIQGKELFEERVARKKALKELEEKDHMIKKLLQEKTSKSTFYFL